MACCCTCSKSAATPLLTVVARSFNPLIAAPVVCDAKVAFLGTPLPPRAKQSFGQTPYPVAAVIQHARMLQRLEAPDYAYNAMRPITMTAAIMLLMIGAFGVVGIFL
jgi:hypothetical protein